MNIEKQNTFSQTLTNEAKMGAYYTDLLHCKWISNFLEFPEGEVCVLEPSIGDMSAVKAVVNNVLNKNVKIFGVELNRETVEKNMKNPDIEKILCADFLNGVKISHSVFSLCFSNPPYGTDYQSGTGLRIERLFLEKLTNYIKSEGVLVYVIPYSVFSEESFLKIWCARYRTFGVYRFHEREFQKYKQVVAFGIKKVGLGYLRKEFEELYESVHKLDTIPLLPTEYDSSKIKIKPSSSENIEYFSTKDFNLTEARNNLFRSSLYKMSSSKLSQTEYSSCSLSSPPIKLKKDLMYLLAVSGGGEGMAGSEENGDLHLQRGNVKVVERSIAEQSDDGEVLYERVTSSSSISMTILENNGKITRLK